MTEDEYDALAKGIREAASQHNRKQIKYLIYELAVLFSLVAIAIATAIIHAY